MNMKMANKIAAIACLVMLSLAGQVSASTSASDSLESKPVRSIEFPNGICTMDINRCGAASICGCPEGYEYDARLGQCLVKDVYQVTEVEPYHQMVKSSCSIQVPDQAICTRDINPAGYPSACGCGEFGEYDARIGQCILKLDQ